MISIDITILFQLVNFVLGLFIINHFMVKPIREVIAKRKFAFGTIKASADEYSAKAAEKLAAYESRITATKNEIIKDREAMKLVAMEKGDAMLANARQEAVNFTEQARHSLDGQCEQAIADLQKRVSDYSELVTQKLLS